MLVRYTATPLRNANESSNDIADVLKSMVASNHPDGADDYL